MSSDSNRISLIIDTLTCPMTRQYYYEIRRQYESPIFIQPDPTTAVASRRRILNDSRLLADGKFVF